MIYRFLLFFTLIVLPLQGITPQLVLAGAQHLYATVRNKDPHNRGGDTDSILQSHSKVYANKVKLLEQARMIAKEKNDTNATQYLTELIAEGQKNFWERHSIICSGILAGLCSYLGYRFGRYIEYREWNISLD